MQPLTTLHRYAYGCQVEETYGRIVVEELDAGRSRKRCGKRKSASLEMASLSTSGTTITAVTVKLLAKTVAEARSTSACASLSTPMTVQCRDLVRWFPRENRPRRQELADAAWRDLMLRISGPGVATNIVRGCGTRFGTSRRGDSVVLLCRPPARSLVGTVRTALMLDTTINATESHGY